jgi:hypothetical protein
LSYHWLGVRQYEAGISPDHAALNIDGAANRIHGACELDQDAVAHGIDHPAPGIHDGRIDQLVPQRLKPRKWRSSSAPVRQL